MRWRRRRSPTIRRSTIRAGGRFSRTRSAVEQASAAAERAGFAVHVDNSCDDWDYERAADYLLKRVRESKKRISDASA